MITTSVSRIYIEGGPIRYTDRIHAATVDDHLQKVGAEAFNKFQRYALYTLHCIVNLRLHSCSQTNNQFGHRGQLGYECSWQFVLSNAYTGIGSYETLPTPLANWEARSVFCRHRSIYESVSHRSSSSFARTPPICSPEKCKGGRANCWSTPTPGSGARASDRRPRLMSPTRL